MAWYDSEPTDPTSWGPPKQPSRAVRRNRHITKVILMVAAIGLFSLLAWPVWAFLLHLGD